jgi:hypothetical protein
MSQGIESHIDWAAPAKARGDRVGPGLASRPPQQATAPEKRNVMDTLLGKNSLSAADLSGNDPYNATGRYFRR